MTGADALADEVLPHPAVSSIRQHGERVGNPLVLHPPLSTLEQAHQLVHAVARSLDDVFGAP